MVSPVGNQQATYNYTKQLLKQNNPTFGDGYWINTVHVNPMNYTQSQTTAPVQQATVTNSDCTDGKDDGSIGFFSAVGHALKGGVKFFTGMFTDEQGNFSLGQTLKTLAIGGAIAAATCIPVVGPLVLPALCTIGVVQGGTKVLSGISTAMNAKTDAEAKAAWEEIGNGATEGIVSYTGYKATGGWKSAISKSKAQYAEQATKFGKLTTEGQKYYDETAAKLNQKTELSSEQIDKNLGLDNNTELNQLNEYYRNLEKQTKVQTKAEKTLAKNKAKEPQVRKSNPLAEEARRNSVNELADKVNRGESTAHTNAEIRQTVDNIDTSRLNGNNRAMVERAAKDVPTEAQQRAYDRQMEYRPATEAQRKAFEDKGGKFVEQETGNATQSLSEVNVKSSNPEVKTLNDVKAQIETTGKIPDGQYLVEMRNGETGIYNVKDGNIEIVDKAGTEFTGKNIARKEATHKAEVEQQIRNGNFVAA